jgi:uncharacterized protein YuzE
MDSQIGYLCRENELLSKDTNSLYFDPSAKPSAESREVAEGVVLDYGEDGNLAGIDIDNASRKLDLSELVTSHIPVRA